MPKAYIDDLRIRVVDSYRSGESAKDVASRAYTVGTDCSRRGAP